MLPGLSGIEIGRLRMSVGYGTHKRGRPLSPVEVGTLLQRAQSAGASLQDCAKCLMISDSQVSRFLGVLELPADIKHLVAFGRSSDSIGFTTAVQLARVNDPDDQRVLAAAVLERGLQMDEVRQVNQLRQRSGRTIEECLQEVLAMRPTVSRHYVFIGAVADRKVEAILGQMQQAERDVFLRSSLEALGLQEASGRLGDKFFTLVGDERLNGKLAKQGKGIIEARLRQHLTAKVTSR